jgi:hypothetical protein
MFAHLYRTNLHQAGSDFGAMMQFFESMRKEQENSGKTVGHLAVILIAEPSTAQDFRGKHNGRR